MDVQSPAIDAYLVALRCDRVCLLLANPFIHRPPIHHVRGDIGGDSGAPCTSPTDRNSGSSAHEPVHGEGRVGNSPVGGLRTWEWNYRQETGLNGSGHWTE